MNPWDRVIKDWLVISLIGALYLALSLYGISRPGFAYEELDEAQYAVQLLQTGSADAAAALNIAGHRLPLMGVNSYKGAFEIYLLLPFLKLFGFTLFALRLPGILAGLFTIILTFLFARQVFSRHVAVITALLLALQPGYLLFSKLPSFSGILTLFSAGSLYFLARWAGKKEAASLALGALLLGIGLWTKIVFVWFILGLAVCYALYAPKETRLSLKNWALATAAFFAGVFPLLVSNLQSRAATVALVARSWFHAPAPASGAVDNQAFVHNLLTRVEQFAGFFGRYDFDSFLPLHGLRVPDIFPLLFASALVFLTGMALLTRDTAKRRKVLAALTMFFVIFTGLCFTVSIFRSYQLLFLVPFPQLILALFISWALQHARQTMSPRHYRTAMAALIAPFVVLVYSNARVIAWTVSRDYVMKYDVNSPVTPHLTGHLLASGIRSVFILDPYHTIARKPWFLSGGRIAFHDLFTADHRLSEKAAGEFHLLTFSSPEAASF
ncbi:MAG: ArnT family glycosyltransferase, partial [Endomicrobiales bacterium]